jgi:hypothetical protein
MALEKNQRYSKKVKNWAIRSQASKSDMIGYEEGSETKWLWVINEGLINLIWLKI